MEFINRIGVNGEIKFVETEVNSMSQYYMFTIY